jgi:hypothetical protein
MHQTIHTNGFREKTIQMARRPQSLKRPKQNKPHFEAALGLGTLFAITHKTLCETTTVHIAKVKQEQAVVLIAHCCLEIVKNYTNDETTESRPVKE